VLKKAFGSVTGAYNDAVDALKNMKPIHKQMDGSEESMVKETELRSSVVREMVDTLRSSDVLSRDDRKRAAEAFSAAEDDSLPYAARMEAHKTLAELYETTKNTETLAKFHSVLNKVEQDGKFSRRGTREEGPPAWHEWARDLGSEYGGHLDEKTQSRIPDAIVALMGNSLNAVFSDKTLMSDEQKSAAKAARVEAFTALKPLLQLDTPEKEQGFLRDFNNILRAIATNKAWTKPAEYNAPTIQKPMYHKATTIANAFASSGSMAKATADEKFKAAKSLIQGYVSMMTNPDKSDKVATANAERAAYEHNTGENVIPEFAGRRVTAADTYDASRSVDNSAFMAGLKREFGDKASKVYSLLEHAVNDRKSVMKNLAAMTSNGEDIIEAHAEKAAFAEEDSEYDQVAGDLTIQSVAKPRREWHTADGLMTGHESPDHPNYEGQFGARHGRLGGFMSENAAKGNSLTAQGFGTILDWAHETAESPGEVEGLIAPHIAAMKADDEMSIPRYYEIAQDKFGVDSQELDDYVREYSQHDSASIELDEDGDPVSEFAAYESGKGHEFDTLVRSVFWAGVRANYKGTDMRFAQVFKPKFPYEEQKARDKSALSLTAVEAAVRAAPSASTITFEGANGYAVHIDTTALVKSYITSTTHHTEDSVLSPETAKDAAASILDVLATQYGKITGVEPLLAAIDDGTMPVWRQGNKRVLTLNDVVASKAKKDFTADQVKSLVKPLTKANKGKTQDELLSSGILLLGNGKGINLPELVRAAHSTLTTGGELSNTSKLSLKTITGLLRKGLESLREAGVAVPKLTVPMTRLESNQAKQAGLPSRERVNPDLYMLKVYGDKTLGSLTKFWGTDITVDPDKTADRTQRYMEHADSLVDQIRKRIESLLNRESDPKSVMSRIKGLDDQIVALNARIKADKRERVNQASAADIVSGKVEADSKKATAKMVEDIAALKLQRDQLASGNIQNTASNALALTQTVRLYDKLQEAASMKGAKAEVAKQQAELVQQRVEAMAALNALRSNPGVQRVNVSVEDTVLSASAIKDAIKNYDESIKALQSALDSAAKYRNQDADMLPKMRAMSRGIEQLNQMRAALRRLEMKSPDYAGNTKQSAAEKRSLAAERVAVFAQLSAQEAELVKLFGLDRQQKTTSRKPSDAMRHITRIASNIAEIDSRLAKLASEGVTLRQNALNRQIKAMLGAAEYARDPDSVSDYAAPSNKPAGETAADRAIISRYEEGKSATPKGLGKSSLQQLILDLTGDPSSDEHYGKVGALEAYLEAAGQNDPDYTQVSLEPGETEYSLETQATNATDTLGASENEARIDEDAELEAAMGGELVQSSVPHDLYDQLMTEVTPERLAHANKLSHENSKTLVSLLMDTPYDELPKSLRELRKELSAKNKRVEESDKFSKRKTDTFSELPADVKAKIATTVSTMFGGTLEQTGDNTFSIKFNGKETKLSFENMGKDVAGFFQESPDGYVMKLALDSFDPASTAYHESLHQLFSILRQSPEGQKIMAVIDKAMSNKIIRDRARNLLVAVEGEKSDAVKQFDGDKEEAAAYAYELWATGQLKLGEATQGVFRRIAEFITTKLLRLSTAAMKTEAFFKYFNSGAFGKDMGNMSTVGKSMMLSKSDVLAETVMRHSKPILDAGRKMLSTTSERMRSYKNPIMDTIADMYELAGGYSDIEHGLSRKWVNKYRAVISGLTADEQSKIMQNLIDGKVTGKHEAAIMDLIKEVDTYAVGRADPENARGGITLSRKLGSLPMVWDYNHIMNNLEEFNKDVAAYGGVAENAKIGNIVNRILNTYGYDETGHGEITPFYFGDEHADKASKWRQKDLDLMMASYIRSMAEKTTHARMFGQNGELLNSMLDMLENGAADADGLKQLNKFREFNNLEPLKEASFAKASDEAVKMAKDYLAAMEGSYKEGSIDPKLRRVMGNATAAVNILALPFGIFSMMVEPVIIGARAGSVTEMIRAYATGFGNIWNSFDSHEKSVKRGPAWQFAADVGAIERAAMLDLQSRFQGTVQPTGWSKKINDAFFKLNLMDGWDRSMRVASTEAARRFIMAHADGKTSPHSARYLKEMGLQPSDIKIEDGELARSEKIDAAILHFVEQSVVHPSPSTNTLWMNDPRFALIAHMKRFTFAFSEKILKRVISEAKNKNYTPMFLLSLAIPVMMVSGWTKMALGATQAVDAASLTSGIAKSGVLGRAQFFTDALADINYGGSGFESALGPTAGLASKSAKDLASGGLGDAMSNFVPLHQLI
jgi:transcriptional regulator CtsR